MFWQREEEWERAIQGYKRAIEVGGKGGEDVERWTRGLERVYEEMRWEERK